MELLVLPLNFEKPPHAEENFHMSTLNITPAENPNFLNPRISYQR